VAAIVHAARLGRLRSSPWTAPLALAAVAGIGLRVYVERTGIGTPDSDEAIVALMVRHALDGHLAVFYWGQPYGGTQEVFLTVPFFWLFGQSWLVLRIVPIAISGLASLVLWRVGLRVFRDTAGKTAGALLWIWPPFAVFYLTHQYGFYASDVFYCSLILLLALRTVERPDLVRAGVFGLVLGLSLWESEQIVPVAVPVILWTICRNPRVLRHAWAAAVAAAVGALPWLVWNARHGWGSLAPLPGGATTYWHRERLFLSPLLGMIAGLRVPYAQTPVLGFARLVDLLSVGLLLLFAAGAVLALRRSRRSEASLLYSVALAFGPLYAISPPTFESREPRYLVVLTPVLALLVAQLATTYRRSIVLLAAACALSFVVLHEMNAFRRTHPGAFSPTASRFGPLIAELDRLHVRRAYGDYFIVYVLDFDARERIVAVENDMHAVTFTGGRVRLAPSFARRPAYGREVAQARSPGFVFFRSELAREAIVAKLERHGYHAHPVGAFVVLARDGS
jgi:hypothetical protein